MYETHSGNVASRLSVPSPSAVVHLVDCKADGAEIELVSSTADSVRILTCSVENSNAHGFIFGRQILPFGDRILSKRQRLRLRKSEVNPTRAHSARGGDAQLRT